VPKEELEKELLDRMTANFSHIAPNGQFLKGRANLLNNLMEKYGAYPLKAFDIQIENVKVIWTHNDLCMVTYEEWQIWRDVDEGESNNNKEDDTNGDEDKPDAVEGEDGDLLKFGRLSSCLLKQRPGNFHWIHVHETWLEGVGPNDVLNTYDDHQSESSGSYDVEVTTKKGVVGGKTPGMDMSLGYRSTEPGGHQDGNPHVRFSNQREEVSYKYKKHPHDSSKKAETGPGATLAGSLPKQGGKPKPSKSPQKKKGKEKPAKPMVMLTPVPPKAQLPSNASRRRHISPQLTDHAKACMVNNELIGISIHGWDIGTGQGPMGDEGWFSAATANFENMAQYKGGPGSKYDTRRRLALPEMVFPAAHVAFEHRKENLWLSWDVLDSMDCWAKAHRQIPVESDLESNGVSVMKSADAQLWANKKKNLLPADKKSKDVFHFDWTYSSPFCGSVEGGWWDPIDQSGLKLDLLKDKSMPILFFDELVLYEDDLHDNGHVQFSIKLRVMPNCGFVLARLWVRIDRVLLRLRETRLLFEFGKTPDEQTKIYRDVTWRECHWQDLSEYNLPTNLQVWMSEGQETPQLAMLMSKLPEVEPPPDIPKHAVLKRGSKPPQK